MATLESMSKPDRPLFVMLKGEPGTRKSTCALSFPGKQYWFSTDQKMSALELPMKRWGLWGKGHLDYDDYIDWDSALGKLKQFETNCPYKTLVVDSVTSIGDAMNRQTIKHKAGKGEGKKIGTIHVPGLEEYNAESSAFMELMARLKDIHKFHKVNVILIAHVVGQRKDDDKNKLTHHSRVIITGGDKISGKISSYMEEVYHFNIKTGFEEGSEGEYELFTSHAGNDYARTSLPLEGRIKFNSEPLYSRWIAPAIKKLYEMVPPQQIQQTQSQPSTPFVTTTPIKESK